ncbi:MAG: Rieske (2Fe-2S) iron-sulfur domain protein [Myxococcales bacterium]|nr:Rieske (2Fe-2S) iron-sulfur domain protein [Myxococcales bacterium]
MALRVRVCLLSEVIPDELNEFKVKGVTWPVIVTIAEGQMFACAGVCPHEDVPLINGLLHEKTLVCGAHFYGFNLVTGRCTHDATLELRRYPITLVGDEVWVDLI